jgi:hypothetical protein
VVAADGTKDVSARETGTEGMIAGALRTLAVGWPLSPVLWTCPRRKLQRNERLLGRPAMVNYYLVILIDELRAEGVADPLAQRFTLAALWDDLASLAGESPPASVRAYLADGAAATISPATPGRCLIAGGTPQDTDGVVGS